MNNHRCLYIKANRKKYQGPHGPNGYCSFEYGYINPDGSLNPVGTEADVITSRVPLRADYIDKDTMRIWSEFRYPNATEIKWKYAGSAYAEIIEKEEETYDD